MIKPDFEAIAEAIASTKMDADQRTNLIFKLATHFSMHYPRFNRQKFVAGCIHASGDLE